MKLNIYLSKHVYLNRIAPDALALYHVLYELVKDKNYFVLTTNADHQFYKAGFGDDKIFATRGLWTDPVYERLPQKGINADMQKSIGDIAWCV